MLPKGKARGLLKNLKAEQGIVTADVHSARGALLQFGADAGQEQTVEKDILQVVVPAALANEVFTFIYHQAGIGEEAGNGFMFQGDLLGSIPYLLPDLSEEE